MRKSSSNVYGLKEIEDAAVDQSGEPEKQELDQTVIS
jgi:hypothetical protein